MRDLYLLTGRSSQFRTMLQREQAYCAKKLLGMVLAPAPLNLRLLAQRGREAHLQSVVSSNSAGGSIGAEEADRWFSEYLEFPCRLVHKPDDDPRLVDSSFAESWDQSTREQAPAVTYARDLSNVRAWVRLRTQPHPRRTRDRPCR